MVILFSVCWQALTKLYFVEGKGLDTWPHSCPSQGGGMATQGLIREKAG